MALVVVILLAATIAAAVLTVVKKNEAAWVAAALLGVLIGGVYLVSFEEVQLIPGVESRGTVTVRELTMTGGKYSKPAVMTDDGRLYETLLPFPAVGSQVDAWCVNLKCGTTGVLDRYNPIAGWCLIGALIAPLGLAWRRGRKAAEFFARWNRAKQADKAQLAELRRTFAGLDARIFGSAVKARPGGFARATAVGPYGPQVDDVDIAVVVELPTWRRWAAEVYGDDAVGGEQFSPRRYERDNPTREKRRVAAERMFDIALSRDLDVFLLPAEFVRGSLEIPNWAYFRTEVLAAWQPLSTLRLTRFTWWNFRR